MELINLLQQLDEIETQSPHDALTLYQPGTQTEPFFFRMCEAYRAASNDQREQIRLALDNKPGVRNNLLGYVYTAAQHLHSSDDRRWLQIGLAAASLENCSTDYRDFLLALANLFVTAERVGIDPRSEFEAAAHWSSTSTPRGGYIPVGSVLTDFHTYTVVESVRRMK